MNNAFYDDVLFPVVLKRELISTEAPHMVKNKKETEEVLELEKNNL